MREFEASSVGQVEFAERHGLKVGTFRSWLYRLRREGRDGGRARAPGAFVEVVPSASSEACCTVRVGTAELRFSRTPSALYLAELLARVGA